MSYIGAIISTTGYILLFSLFLTGCTHLSGNSFFDSDEFKAKVYYSNDGMDDGRSLKERLETLERNMVTKEYIDNEDSTIARKVDRLEELHKIGGCND